MEFIYTSYLNINIKLPMLIFKLDAYKKKHYIILYFVTVITHFKINIYLYCTMEVHNSFLLLHISFSISISHVYIIYNI